MGNHEGQRAGVKWGKESNHGGGGGGCGGLWAVTNRFRTPSFAIYITVGQSH